MLNLSILLEASARELPDRSAIVLGPTRLTYAQVNAMANQIAGALTAGGLKPGDRVALSCPNVPYFAVVYFGILKAGGTVVPLNVLLKGREIAYHLQDSGARFYFCFEGTDALPMGQQGHEGFEATEGCETMVVLTADPKGQSPLPGVPTLGEFIAGQPPTFDTVQRPSDATAVILYTSGTTGQPKGAELTHVNMLLNARLADSMYPPHPHDVHLLTLPLFHSFGQTVQMNGGFYRGATLALMPRFDPAQALQLMQDEKVTLFAGVPTMYWALLNHPGAEQDYDLPAIAERLRIAMSGGAALPVEILERFEERFGVRILEGYGLSETSPVATFNRVDGSKPGSVGTAVWGVEVRVVDAEDKPVPTGETGEILIRGHNVMKGYLGRPEATAHSLRGGWLHTGDVGRLDEDGYLYIVDRVKDMIIRGGYNVYPRELEEVLLTHPAVSLAAVIGVPEPSLGEEVKAFVILKDGAQATPEQIIAWSREQMAAYKYPRQVEIRQSLPMTATGKILKRELRG